MRKINVILILICFLTNSKSFSQETKPFEISHLTENTYVYTTFKKYKADFYPANGLYIVTKDGIILIDALWDETQTIPLLDSIEKKHKQKVKLCVTTHYHDDRTSGLDILKSRGVKTYASSQSKILGVEHKEKTTEFVFANDTIFNLGEIKFETFYPGHGHTKDNIVIWFPNQKVLFGGCFLKDLKSKSLGNVEDANIEEWKKAIAKVILKYGSAKYVIPGHYKWSDTKILKHTQKLLELNK